MSSYPVLVLAAAMLLSTGLALMIWGSRPKRR